MLAHLQKLITLSLLGWAGLWALWFSSQGRPGWAVCGAVFIVGGYAVFLAAEFVMLRWVHGADPAPRASVVQLLKAWCMEVITAPRIFGWQQPFHSHRYPDHLLPGTGHRGVVLVHGFVCNRGFWNRWMPRLRAQGVPFVAVNLEPVFGSISDYIATIEHAVRQVEVATGQPVILVGHSMGGLAIRAWMAAYKGVDRVHRVVTVGSPHHGTWLGRFASNPNACEMALGSAWLKALQMSEPPKAFARFTCFYSHCDNIVFPASTATLPGADNRHVVGSAHMQLADQPEVLDAVLGYALMPG